MRMSKWGDRVVAVEHAGVEYAAAVNTTHIIGIAGQRARRDPVFSGHIENWLGGSTAAGQTLVGSLLGGGESWLYQRLARVNDDHYDMNLIAPWFADMNRRQLVDVAQVILKEGAEQLLVLTGANWFVLLMACSRRNGAGVPALPMVDGCEDA